MRIAEFQFLLQKFQHVQEWQESDILYITIFPCGIGMIRRVLDEHPDCKALYPIHMNPVVRQAAEEELGDCKQSRIIEPVEVFDCHNFEARSFFVFDRVRWNSGRMSFLWCAGSCHA